MYDIDFMSDDEYCMKYGINPAALALGLIAVRAMVYDQVTRKICVVNLLGMSESQVYQALCHELLHAVLHKVMGEKICIALDKVSNVVDGEHAFIWIGEDWTEADI